MPTRKPYTFKPLQESLWEMLSLWWGRTGVKPDSRPGSVLRTLFEAVGFEVEDITFRFDNALDQAIPFAVFEAFGFAPLPASVATLPLTFSRAAAYATPLVVPKGFRVARADGVEYQTLSDATIPSGETAVTVSAAAVRPGETGNTGPNTVNLPRSSLPTLTGVTNPQNATGGADEESLDDQKRRFARYIARVHRATLPALEAAARDVVTPAGERAREVLILDQVDRPVLAPGVIEVWIDDGYASASADLLVAVHAEIDRFRAAGTLHRTGVVLKQNVDVVFVVEGAPAALEAAKEAARRYVRNLRIGQKVSRENLLSALTTAHPGVSEITLEAPAADVAVSQISRAVLGALSGTLA